MPVQRSRFHTSANPPPNRQVRQEIVEPVAGLNRQRPATNLRPGETPFSQNFIMGDRFIEPRSGLSTFAGSSYGGSNGSTSVTSTPLNLFVTALPDGSGEQAFIVSNRTIRTYNYPVASYSSNWLEMPFQLYHSLGMSSSTNDYFTAAPGNTPSSASTSGFKLFITNGVLFPKVITIGIVDGIGNNNPAIRELTELFSIDSVAKYVAAIDQRLVFFNSAITANSFDASSATTGIMYHPTRVIWSARGNSSDFTNGGFEDLVGMKGVGSGAVAERDRLVLLSTKEIWVGNPRRDAYAFDFVNLDKAKGCPQINDRTPQNTEAGTIWLGDGHQFYRLYGTAVRALGDKVRDTLKDELREQRHAFSVYDPAAHIYAYFYSSSSGSYPHKALFLRTDTVAPSGPDRDDGRWFMQDFGALQFTAGSIYSGDLTLVSSRGTAYRLLSTHTTDAGTAIDCRWRSHALRAEKDIFPYEALQECWLEYEYDGTQTSTISLFQSGDNGASFTAIASSSLTTGTNYSLIPVTAPAARNQMFEWRLNDGSKPRLARFELTLRGYSGRHSGTL